MKMELGVVGKSLWRKVTTERPCQEHWQRREWERRRVTVHRLEYSLPDMTPLLMTSLPTRPGCWKSYLLALDEPKLRCFWFGTHCGGGKQSRYDGLKIPTLGRDVLDLHLTAMWELLEVLGSGMMWRKYIRKISSALDRSGDGERTETERTSGKVS